MRFQSYFNTAIRIIELYNGSLPLSHFLKQYFSENKKHGSKDRKFITHACYNYFRTGNALKNYSTEERLKISLFLCNKNAGDWKILFDDKWLNKWNEILGERIAFIKTVYASFNVNEIFPVIDVLSSGIDIAAFIQSHLIQPDVFLRIRNHHDQIIKKLQQHEILFGEIEENCIAISNTTKIDSVINIDDEAVIQDYSSQRIKELLEIIKSQILNPDFKIHVWDCCAGSGGKSILAYDILQKINLTVSDIRSSIIHNLNDRFKKAGIINYKSFVTDITNSKNKVQNLNFDLIICDAPCTGSGTWGRTPEQLYFFQSKKIEDYTALQQRIVSNASNHLKEQGYFLYITCSVFKAENEDMVEFIQKKFQFTLIKTKLLKGYSKKADTIFAALFKK